MKRFFTPWSERARSEGTAVSCPDGSGPAPCPGWRNGTASRPDGSGGAVRHGGGFLARHLCMVFFLLIALTLFTGCGKQERRSVRIGVGLYRSDDTFINNLRKELERCAKEYEQSTGEKVTLDIQAAKGNQSTQNRQVEQFVSLDCDVLCINPVDRLAVSSIIDRAMEADIPLVFFNRQPSEEDMGRWDRLCYVGVDARETAVLQGNIVADCFEKTPEKLDRNRDGILSYVLLEGEPTHQDSLIRTEWSVRTLRERGVPLKRVAGGIGNWERNQAAALMEQWLDQYPGQIELVLSNNDDMALGALDTMERRGVENIQVVGIDATEPGLEAVRSGRMMGTVSSDKKGYAEEIFRLAMLLKDKGTVPEQTYFWIRQEPLSADQAAE